MKVTKKKNTVFVRRTIVGFVLWILFSALMTIGFSVIAYLKFLWINLGDGMVVVETWSDLNGDGIRDDAEPPLEGVCILVDYSNPNLNPETCQNSWMYTDENGQWDTMVGGNAPVFVTAIAPQGYRPTTPPVIRNDPPDQFGFTPISIDVKPQILSMKEYAEIYRLEEEKELLREKIILTVSLFAYLIISVAISWFLAIKLVRPLRRLKRQV